MRNSIWDVWSESCCLVTIHCEINEWMLWNMKGKIRNEAFSILLPLLYDIYSFSSKILVNCDAHTAYMHTQGDEKTKNKKKIVYSNNNSSSNIKKPTFIRSPFHIFVCWRSELFHVCYRRCLFAFSCITLVFINYSRTSWCEKRISAIFISIHIRVVSSGS